MCSVPSNIQWCLCCCRLGHNPAKREQFLVWVPAAGLALQGAVHSRSGMHDSVGRDVLQHLLYLAFAPSSAVSSAFSLKNVLCSFPVKENRVFRMGWLHLHSVGMNVFAGGKLEPVAARRLFWRACEKSASNLPSFKYMNIYFF